MDKETLSGLPVNYRQLTVQKSHPLASLWNSSWTLTEFKLLDVYLARIDSHHPEKRSVRLEKGELEQILGVTRINLPDLQARLDKLIVPVHVDDPELPRGRRTIALFANIGYTPDETGLWQIELKCSPEAMQYIFNIENIGYLRYKLQSVIHLTSKRSYLLFLYIEQNRFRQQWEVDLDDLHRFLDCQASYYEEYKRFNARILKRSREEIIANTGCRFRYEPVRKGRRVQKIRFLVEDIPILEAPKREIIDVPQEKLHGRSLLKTALVMPEMDETEFSPGQVDELLSYVAMVPLSAMPASPGLNSPDLRRHNYLHLKFVELNRRTEAGEVRRRFPYLLAMIKEDAGVG